MHNHCGSSSWPKYSIEQRLICSSIVPLCDMDPLLISLRRCNWPNSFGNPVSELRPLGETQFIQIKQGLYIRAWMKMAITMQSRGELIPSSLSLIWIWLWTESNIKHGRGVGMKILITYSDYLITYNLINSVHYIFIICNYIKLNKAIN